MHGRIFSYEHKAGLEVEIVASFGGLLMSLKGDQSQLANLEMDQVVYLLMRKGGP
jgi:DNA-directed RNA polymerase I, II, and III subunit RPABC3